MNDYSSLKQGVVIDSNTCSFNTDLSSLKETSVNFPICNYYHYEICCAEVLANDILFTTVNASAFVTDIESEGDTKIELVKV